MLAAKPFASLALASTLIFLATYALALFAIEGGKALAELRSALAMLRR